MNIPTINKFARSSKNGDLYLYKENAMYYSSFNKATSVKADLERRNPHAVYMVDYKKGKGWCIVQVK